MDAQMLCGFRGRIVSQVGLLDVFVAQASEAMLLPGLLTLFIADIDLAAYRGMTPVDGASRRGQGNALRHGAFGANHDDLMGSKGFRQFHGHGAHGRGFRPMEGNSVRFTAHATIDARICHARIIT